jgi:hypothetical protein
MTMQSAERHQVDGRALHANKSTPSLYGFDEEVAENDLQVGYGLMERTC